MKMKMMRKMMKSRLLHVLVKKMKKIKLLMKKNRSQPVAMPLQLRVGKRKVPVLVKALVELLLLIVNVKN